MNATEDMAGKVVLVTGATSGLGAATSRALAEAGATIVMVGHDPAHGEQARREVAAAGGQDRVHLLGADLSSMQEVRRLAEEVRSRFDRLDVLVNNAGVDVGSRSTTVDGHELTLAVNYLAPFLLTTSLLDRLTDSAPARIVNVASSGHRGGKINLDDLQSEHQFSGQKAYNNSKLALVLFTYELARRLRPDEVTANCVDPGFVRGTNLGRTLPAPYQVIGILLTPFMVTPARGAQTAVWAASSPEAAGRTGKYFKRGREVKSSAATHDVDLARRLWDATESLLAANDDPRS